MAELPDWLSKETEVLKRMRDEAKLKLHLARAEARDAFEGIEKQWQHLEGKLEQIRREARSDLGEIVEAAKLLTEQIREGYHNLKTLL